MRGRNKLHRYSDESGSGTQPATPRLFTRRNVTQPGIVWLLAVVTSATVSEAQIRRKLDRYQVVKVFIEDESQLKTLLALDEASRDVEIWSDRLGLGVIDVRVSREQRRLLDASGLKYKVHIEDVQRRLDELFAGAREEYFFDAYRTYDEHIAFMNDLVTAYPDLAEMISVGRSLLSRPMWAIRITGPGENKPGVMYHGAQHGNEIMGACVIAYMAESLLTGYDSDPTVQNLVDNVEWFLLPIMNPDGYESGSRRNARDVDLNRNWGGPGCYPDPFSEPETAAMRDFFLSHPNIRAYIDFHTHGKMIMWAWGYTDELCEDNGTFDHIGTEMADLIYLSRGSDYDRLGPIYTTIYPVHGGSVDYTYGVSGLWAITYELGYSHDMPISEIVPTCVEIAPAMMFLSSWIDDCNGNGISDADDVAPGGASEDCNENLTPDECEFLSDFDGDGVVDACDFDTDDDGIPTDADVCDFTPIGTPVDADGRPISDANGNCDIDLWDHARFANCLTQGGPGIPPYHPVCLVFFDYDADGDVDMADAAAFSDVFTGIR